MKDIRELAKAHRAEFDALKIKSVDTDALMASLEKVKGSLHADVLTQMDKIKEKKGKRK